MLKVSIPLTLVLLICNCSAKIEDDLKTISLNSGKTLEVSVEPRQTNDQPKMLFVEISGDQKIPDEKSLDEDVLEIWAKLENTAAEGEFEEAIIKYRYLIEDINEKGESEKIFVISVYSAEKTENGKWKIDKIG